MKAEVAEDTAAGNVVHKIEKEKGESSAVIDLS